MQMWRDCDAIPISFLVPSPQLSHLFMISLQQPGFQRSRLWFYKFIFFITQGKVPSDFNLFRLGNILSNFIPLIQLCTMELITAAAAIWLSWGTRSPMNPCAHHFPFPPFHLYINTFTFKRLNRQCHSNLFLAHNSNLGCNSIVKHLGGSSKPILQAKWLYWLC